MPRKFLILKRKFLQPYQAIYDVHSDGETLGSSTREIIFNSGQWTIKTNTKLKKWLLTLKSKEHSNFNIQSGKLLTHEFFTSSKVTFQKEKEILQSFNWQNKLETGKKDDQTWQLPLKKPVFDRMSHILELRKDLIRGSSKFNYLVSYKGKRKMMVAFRFG